MDFGRYQSMRFKVLTWISVKQQKINKAPNFRMGLCYLCYFLRGTFGTVGEVLRGFGAGFASASGSALAFAVRFGTDLAFAGS
mmetsp:Transcript_20770/g.27304  ORF Transcript_20770/g.27304 Transcript_20770/m.27304 type:complete len:83 (-) Transcript_20770:912-1160(-)